MRLWFGCRQLQPPVAGRSHTTEISKCFKLGLFPLLHEHWFPRPVPASRGSLHLDSWCGAQGRLERGRGAVTGEGARWDACGT